MKTENKREVLFVESQPEKRFVIKNSIGHFLCGYTIIGKVPLYDKNLKDEKVIYYDSFDSANESLPALGECKVVELRGGIHKPLIFEGFELA